MLMTKRCNSVCCEGGCGAVGSKNTDAAEREFTVALVGQPNTGKSTLFNSITGANQHVGNWPGKTVEKKEGRYEYGGRLCHLYDLPGTYSLTANSLEEVIAREFVIKEKPDVLVIVVDAAQLERSLYMVAETLLLPIPKIIALNKMDVAANNGLTIDPVEIEKATGLRTIPLSASRKEGVDRLLEAIADENVANGNVPSIIDEYEKGYGDAFRRILAEVKQSCPVDYLPEWVSARLLEEDQDIRQMMQNRLDATHWRRLVALLDSSSKGMLVGASVRFNWIGAIVKQCTHNNGIQARRNRFDKLATQPFVGEIIALLVLFAGVVAAYLVATPLLMPGFGLLYVSALIRKTTVSFFPDWLIAMFADGLISSLGIASMMLGFIYGVFFILGLLENTGYLARLAYIFDPLMKRVGLHGKSVMPLLMGFVCNVMGVAGTRIIDSWRQRLTTLVIVPIVPCKALIIVLAFVGAVFFGPGALLVYASLGVVMLAYIFLSSFILRKYVLPGEQTGLIMEMPPYQRPNWKSNMAYALTQTKLFYKRAFWLIVGTTFLTWAGIYFPDGNIETSYLASFGKVLEPYGQIIGLDWRLTVSLLIAFASKEATLGAMAMIFGVTSSLSNSLGGIVMDKAIWTAVENNLGSFLVEAGITTASALAFMFAVFFSLPCFSTLSMIYAETGSVKWTAATLLFYSLTSITMGAMAYQMGLLLF